MNGFSFVGLPLILRCYYFTAANFAVVGLSPTTWTIFEAGIGEPALYVILTYRYLLVTTPTRAQISGMIIFSITR